LDILWSQQGRIKTFQALELKMPDVQVTLPAGQFHPARYVHAEFDLDDGNCRHFDGAVQLYDEEAYSSRRDSDFNYNNKHQMQMSLVLPIRVYPVKSASERQIGSPLQIAG